MRASKNDITCPWDHEQMSHTISSEHKKGFENWSLVNKETSVASKAVLGHHITMTFFHQLADACRWIYSMPNVINVEIFKSSYCRAICPVVCDEQCI